MLRLIFGIKHQDPEATEGENARQHKRTKSKLNE